MKDECMTAVNLEENMESEETGERFQILERQCDIYRGRCMKLQQENKRLKDMLAQIQKLVC